MYAYKHTYTHTHLETHSYIQTHIIAQRFSLFVTLILFLSQKQTHTHSLSLTHTHKHKYTLFITRTHAQWHSNMSTLHSNTQQTFVSLSFSLSLTHTHTHASFFRTDTHALSQAHNLDSFLLWKEHWIYGLGASFSSWRWALDWNCDLEIGHSLLRHFSPLSLSLYKFFIFSFSIFYVFFSQISVSFFLLFIKSLMY